MEYKEAHALWKQKKLRAGAKVKLHWFNPDVPDQILRVLEMTIKRINISRKKGDELVIFSGVPDNMSNTMVFTHVHLVELLESSCEIE